MKKVIVSILTVLLTLSAVQGSNWKLNSKFGGGKRQAGVAFVIGQYGYVYGGVNGSTNYKDLWRFDPTSNIWTQMASTPGSSERVEAAGFVINGYGYVGTGGYVGGYFKDFYKYDPTGNTWTAIKDFPANWTAARAFAIDSIGFVFGGLPYGGSANRNLWSYSPTQNKWISKASLPSSYPARTYPTVAAYNGKGYIMGGFNGGTTYNDFYSYDPSTDVWTKLSSFPGNSRTTGSSFVIDSMLYFGLGKDGSSHYKDWYKYNPRTDKWSSVDDYPIDSSYGNAFFAIGKKGYIVAGQKNAICTDKVYEYSLPLASTISTTEQIEKSLVYCPSGSKIVKLKSAISQTSVIYMYNDKGQLTAKIGIHDFDANLSFNAENFASGVYFIKLVENQKIIVTKISI